MLSALLSLVAGAGGGSCDFVMPKAMSEDASPTGVFGSGFNLPAPLSCGTIVTEAEKFRWPSGVIGHRASAC